MTLDREIELMQILVQNTDTVPSILLKECIDACRKMRSYISQISQVADEAILELKIQKEMMDKLLHVLDVARDYVDLNRETQYTGEGTHFDCLCDAVEICENIDEEDEESDEQSEDPYSQHYTGI